YFNLISIFLDKLNLKKEEILKLLNQVNTNTINNNIINNKNTNNFTTDKKVTHTLNRFAEYNIQKNINSSSKSKHMRSSSAGFIPNPDPPLPLDCGNQNTERIFK